MLCLKPLIPLKGVTKDQPFGAISCSAESVSLAAREDVCMNSVTCVKVNYSWENELSSGRLQVQVSRWCKGIDSGKNQILGQVECCFLMRKKEREEDLEMHSPVAAEMIQLQRP